MKKIDRSACGSARRAARAVRLTASMETLHWKCIVVIKVPNRTAAAPLEKRINGNAPLFLKTATLHLSPWYLFSEVLDLGLKMDPFRFGGHPAIRRCMAGYTTKGYHAHNYFKNNFSYKPAIRFVLNHDIWMGLFCFWSHLAILYCISDYPAL